jgi:hypothetical protein
MPVRTWLNRAAARGKLLIRVAVAMSRFAK